THTLTANTPDVNRTSYTVFTVTMSTADRISLIDIMDKDGMTASDGAAYTLSAADDWCTQITNKDTSDTTGNPVEVINANHLPHLTVANTAFTEGNGATAMDAAATAWDADGDTDWDSGASLTVQITDGAHADDELAIDTSGDLSISGGNLSHSNKIIAALSDTSGTVNDGIVTENATMTINFTANATNNLVQELVRAVTYRNTSEDPTADATTRTVTFILKDKEGRETMTTPLITITPKNQEPAVINTGLTGAHSIDEGSTSVITTAQLEGTDPDDRGASLIFTVTTLPAHGTLWKDADNDGMLDAGEEIIENGSFTQEEIDNNLLKYSHDGGETLSDSFVFTLADGGEDGARPLTGQTFDITIDAVNDTPVITCLDNDRLVYVMGSGVVVMDQANPATVTDTDSINFDGGDLTVWIQDNLEDSEDLLTIDTLGEISIDNDGSVTNGDLISVSGTVVAEITGNTGNALVLSFNQIHGNATPARIQEILRAMAYRNINTVTATESTRTIRFVLTDGDGGTSADNDLTIIVTRNTQPTSADNGITLEADAIHTFNISDFPFSDANDDTLQKVRIVAPPDSGTLALSNNPIIIGDEVAVADLGDLTFTPISGQSGTPYTSFTFKVHDGKDYSLDPPQTMTINVTPLDTDGDGIPDCNDNDDSSPIESDNQTVENGQTSTNTGTHSNVTLYAGGTVDNSGILSDLVNGGTVNGGTVSGGSSNKGRLNNVSLAPETDLNNRGGVISGTTKNNGTVFGGSIQGEMINNGTISGNAPDGTTDPDYEVTIEKDAKVSGGQIEGLIANNGTLNDVTLGKETRITFGESGRLTGTVLVFFEDGGVFSITIPEDVFFPDSGDATGEDLILTPRTLRQYAEEHGWENTHSLKMMSATAKIKNLSAISNEYLLINGLILTDNAAKSTSSMTVSIPYEASDLPDGYSSQDLLALIYDDAVGKWKPASFTLSDSGTMDIRTEIISAYAAVVRPQAVEASGGYVLGAVIGDTTEDGETATFTITLASPPLADVTIEISSSDTTEGSVFPATLTFTPENWDLPVSVTITGIDDNIEDGDQTYHAVLAPAVSLDFNYSGVAPDDVAVKNLDNDLAPSGGGGGCFIGSLF
ncbi:MAG: cadherin-like domain-containing protein, partial [Desulfobacterium sp.]